MNRVFGGQRGGERMKGPGDNTESQVSEGPKAKGQRHRIYEGQRTRGPKDRRTEGPKEERDRDQNTSRAKGP